jgi:hypothetical protein
MRAGVCLEKFLCVVEYDLHQKYAESRDVDRNGGHSLTSQLSGITVSAQGSLINGCLRRPRDRVGSREKSFGHPGRLGRF